MNQSSFTFSKLRLIHCPAPGSQSNESLSRYQESAPRIASLLGTKEIFIYVWSAYCFYLGARFSERDFLLNVNGPFCFSVRLYGSRGLARPARTRLCGVSPLRCKPPPTNCVHGLAAPCYCLQSLAHCMAIVFFTVLSKGSSLVFF